MKTKILTMLIISLFAVNADAECIMRSTTAAKDVSRVAALSDIKPVVTPISEHKIKCSITARVLYNHKWETIYGDNEGMRGNDDEVCTIAVEKGVEQFTDLKESQIHSEQQVVCTDEEPIEVKPVHIGEVVRQSEVRIDPDSLVLFPYNGTMCKKFIEPEMIGGKLRTWKGVICQTGRVSEDRWAVVDKY
jgi:hypothetical protein